MASFPNFAHHKFKGEYGGPNQPKLRTHSREEMQQRVCAMAAYLDSPDGHRDMRDRLTMQAALQSWEEKLNNLPKD